MKQFNWNHLQEYKNLKEQFQKANKQAKGAFKTKYDR